MSSKYISKEKLEEARKIAQEKGYRVIECTGRKTLRDGTIKPFTYYKMYIPSNGKRGPKSKIIKNELRKKLKDLTEDQCEKMLNAINSD
jgi:hypothetical protein